MCIRDRYYPDANAEGAHFLQTWTMWDGDLFSLNKNTYTKSDDNGERRAYKTRIQYRPETGTGFYLCLYEDSIDESYLWVTGEVQGYLYNGPFTRRNAYRDGGDSIGPVSYTHLTAGISCWKPCMRDR